MQITRYSPRRIRKQGDVWGIWDNETQKFAVATVEGGPRWHSSSVGASYCAQKWNEQGREAFEASYVQQLG